MWNPFQASLVAPLGAHAEGGVATGYPASLSSFFSVVYVIPISLAPKTKYIYSID
jgi:hypothetical protein